MNHFKRVFALLVCICLMAAALAGCGGSSSSSTPAASDASTSNDTAASAPAESTEIDYPTKDIQGSIMWSAGGVCDMSARAIGAVAQDALGANIIFTNRAGSGGAVSTTYVNAQAADGYELLFGAENPQIAKVMGTAEIDYDDFTPIDLYCTTYAAVSVSKDSPYNTLEELMDAILANPGKIVMATTGAGGLPEVVAAMFADVVGTDPILVPFDGENECMTAIMGGNADYTITTLGSAAAFYQSGDIKLLSMIAESPVEGYEDIPIVVDSYADFSKYVPWGPFYGVFVKNGTDQAIVDKLTDIFSAAAEDSDFQQLLRDNGCFPMNVSGDEAVEYVKSYRSITSWLLYNSGATQNSPEDFGIEKP